MLSPLLLRYTLILVVTQQIVSSMIKLLHNRSPAPRLSSSSLSIISFNILLPNSADGWWCYKMYSPRNNVDPSQTEWPARRALIRQTIVDADCDVVCLQETSGESFNEDFSFMAELGYTSELYKKGRFRPATFWRSSRVELAEKPMHRDRCLVTQFKLKPAVTNPTESASSSCEIDASTGDTSTAQDKRVWVANVHLQVCHY
jgi:mRNA deadenylase 3'-5' endonuclease subunit Ccr4